MLSVTYEGKKYNVDVKEIKASSGGTRRKQSKRRNKKRSKPTRRIKR